MNRGASSFDPSVLAQEGFLAAVARIAIAAAAVPIAIVAVCQWAAVQQTHAKAALVRDLAGQGLTAAQIEPLLVEPGARARHQDQKDNLTAQLLAIETGLRRDLVSLGLPADDVQLVLRAWSGTVVSPGKNPGAALDAARKEAEWVKERLKGGRQAKEVAELLRSPLREGGSAPAPAVAASEDRDGGC